MNNRVRLFQWSDLIDRLRRVFLGNEVKEVDPKLAKRFTEIYQNNSWGDPESVSGWGSRVDSPSVEEARSALRYVRETYGFRSMNDIPCGDINWMRLFLAEMPDIKYKGFDIVSPLIEKNRAIFPQFEFYDLDVTMAVLPKADLIFSKDLFNHLPYSAIRKALENMKKSRSTYLLASNNFGFENVELTGDSRHIDLCASPFNLAAPI